MENLENLLRAGFDTLGLPLTDAALSRYRTYFTLLEERSQVMNLTAIHGEQDVARLHFLDCAALLAAAEFPENASVIDVGTGAGFPGLPLKIARPELRVTLLDSLAKRVGFLSEVCAALGFGDTPCIHARAEEAPELRGQFDFAVSRAVARLQLLCELCLPFVRVGGLFAAMKGPDCAQELREAERAIRTLGAVHERTVTYTVPGTDAVHTAVLLRKTEETPAKYPRRWAKIQKAPL